MIDHDWKITNLGQSVNLGQSKMKTIGIDIGGTNIKIVLLGKIVERSVVMKTPKSQQALLKVLKNLLRNYPLSEVKGIGVAVAGLVEAKGKIVRAPNLPFKPSADLSKFFKQFHKRTVFDNDVKCIALAESKFGSIRKFKNVLLIVIGTGIGGALIVNGRLYRGQGSAGEIGKIILEHGKTFEQLASGKSLHTRSKTEFHRLAKYVGIASANLINTFSPEALVFAGGVVSHAGGKFL